MIAARSLLLLLPLAGCTGGEEVVRLQPGEGVLAASLRVELASEPDRLGAGIGWRLSITNAGEAQLDDLVLVLDDAWSVPVRRLRVDPRACATGEEDPGQLPVGRTLVVRSSHDLANHFLFRSSDAEPYPADRVPSAVTVESAGAQGRWARRP